MNQNLNHIDNHYLNLQIKNKFYTINCYEFQSFFEDIMLLTNKEFQKVTPYGKFGDAGNDGFIEELGYYYQVYSPINPRTKDADAAKKILKDFEKLQNSIWLKNREIHNYYFVYNDKFHGLTSPIYDAKNTLEKDNPGIKFEIINATKIKQIILDLSIDELLQLGFNIDQRNSIKIIKKYLDLISIELNKENINNAFNLLNDFDKEIIKKSSQELYIDYEILYCRYYKKIEDYDTAIIIYDDLISEGYSSKKIFMEYYQLLLFIDDNQKKQYLIEQTKLIDKDYWLLLNYTKNKIENIDLFDELIKKEIDVKIKISLILTKANIYAENKLLEKALIYIKQAIFMNKNLLFSYITKLILLHNNLLINNDQDEVKSLSKKIFETIDQVKMIFDLNTISNRSNLIINYILFQVHLKNKDFLKLDETNNKIYFFLEKCYFDNQIESILISILNYSKLESKGINNIYYYLLNQNKNISIKLYNMILFHALNSNIDKEITINFFEEKKQKKYLIFFEKKENQDLTELNTFFKDNIELAEFFIHRLENQIELKAYLIENFFKEGSERNNILKLIFNIDTDNYEQIHYLIKICNLNKVSPFHLFRLIDILLLNTDYLNLIKITKILNNNYAIDDFKLKYIKFISYTNLEDDVNIIKTGYKLLDNFEKNSYISKENVIRNILITHLKIAIIDKENNEKALKLLENNFDISFSYEFLTTIAYQVCIDNKKYQQAYNMLVEAIITKKNMTKQDYGNLYLQIMLNLNKNLPITLDSQNKIGKNHYIKFKDNTFWYFMGNNPPLEAIKLNNKSEKYKKLLNKKITDQINFSSGYLSKKDTKEIELIYTLEQYIFWMIRSNFITLSHSNDLENVTIIDLPSRNDKIDISYLEKALIDFDGNDNPIINLYKDKNHRLPFSILTYAEGNILKAIDAIIKNQSYIYCNNGELSLFQREVINVNKIIHNQESFYIDGTSIFALINSGLFEKITNILPQLLIPKSVLDFLEKFIIFFEPSENIGGYMNYQNGKIQLTDYDKEKNISIQKIFINAIEQLKKHSNIKYISQSQKINCNSELIIPKEFCDAYILARDENLSLMTEDYYYSKYNNIETNKKTPKTFSTFSFVKAIYELHLITLQDYLQYYYFLSKNRYYFLHFSCPEFKQAIFGEYNNDQRLKNIKLFNIGYTLSKDYGVSEKFVHDLILEIFLLLITNNKIDNIEAISIIDCLITEYPNNNNKENIIRSFYEESREFICINKIREKNIYNSYNISSKLNSIMIYMNNLDLD